MNKLPNSNPLFSGPILLSLSFGSLAFWLLGTFMDIYSVGILGAIYELLWLPFLIVLFGLPILSFLRWKKIRFATNSISFYTFLLSSISLIAFLGINLTSL